jgi:probable phosphoglycerate mutase
MKTIYLIRHGETEFNKLKLIQGSGVDSSLNETGLSQAEAFFEKHYHVKFDKVYTSKLKRTHESVQKFLLNGVAWEQHAGLNEISWGHKEGRAATTEENAEYYETLKLWRAGQTHLAMEGGESPAQVLARQIPVVETIMSRPEEENILVCMHGRAIRILLCHLLNYDLRYMDMFEHRNLCLYKLRHTGTMFSAEFANHI